MTYQSITMLLPFMILLKARIDAQMYSAQLAHHSCPPSSRPTRTAHHTLTLSVRLFRPVAGWVQTLLSWDVWLHVGAR